LTVFDKSTDRSPPNGHSYLNNETPKMGNESLPEKQEALVLSQSKSENILGGIE
jgi:hypothetical protein